MELAKRIFLSFSRADETAANLLYLLLEKLLGSREYIFKANEHKSGIEGGEDWRDRIRNELSTVGGLLALVTPNFTEDRWFWIEAGAVWVRDTDRVLLLAAPSVSPPDVTPFDHKQLAFLDAERRPLVRDAISKMCKGVCDVDVAWTAEADALLEGVLSTVAATAAATPVRNYEILWRVPNDRVGGLEIELDLELTDLSCALDPPYSEKQLAAIKDLHEGDHILATAYNASLERALADQDLKAAWLQWKARDRFKHAAVDCGISISSKREVHDLLLTLEFPPEIEVFEAEKMPEEVGQPKLPFRRKLSVEGNPLQDMQLVDVAKSAFDPTDLENRLRLNARRHVHVEGRRVVVQMNRTPPRRWFDFEGEDEGIKIAALGPAGSYKVKWSADATEQDAPECGELAITIEPHPDEDLLRRRGALRSFGAPMQIRTKRL